MNNFEGIWIPLVTPFREGKIDIDAAQRLATHFSTMGISGLVVGGTTGEASALNDAESEMLLRAVIDATSRRCRVVMGVSGNHTETVQRTVMHLNDRFEISGYLVSTPYYVRPSQEGIRRHFEAIADVSAHPLVLYNIPYRSGVNMDLATAKVLANHPRILAIKEAGAGNIDQLTDLIQETPLTVLSGEDHLIFIALCLGGHGAISAAAHVRPDLFVRLFRHVRAEEWISARGLWNTLLPVVRALFSEPNPAPLKYVLATQGWMTEELRLPLTPVSDVCRTRLVRAVEQLDVEQPFRGA